MPSALIPTLRSSISTMTPALAKVAERVLGDPGAVIYQSITELAERCGASEGSIMRFCREQGYVGFQDFKLALARELAKQEKVDAGSLPEDEVQALVRTAALSLEETGRLLDRDMLMSVARRLNEADIVDTYGAAASSITAKYFEYKMMRIGAKCRAFEDPHLAMMAAATSDSSRVCVVISSSGSTKETVQVAELARSKGAYVIGVTNRAKSPLAVKCNAVFVAAWSETPHTGGAFPSKISQLLIVDAIVSSVLSVSPDRRAAIDDTAQSVTLRSY